MGTTKEHWENVFATKAENEVSWFQPYPKTSVEFFELFNLPLDANIIDVGGGDRHLVDVFIGKPTEVISLPQTAIVYSETSPFVFKVVNHKAVKTNVKLGVRGDVNINIESGLKDGDLVIVAGQQKLFDGAPVG